MNELKQVLGKEGESVKGKGLDKSKSESMWVIEDDTPKATAEQSDVSAKGSESSTEFLDKKFVDYFRRDKKITHATLDCIIEDFQQSFGGGKSELSYLLAMEDRISDLIEESPQEKAEFLEAALKIIEEKIALIRKREKKSNLLEFEKIVNANFKKSKPISQNETLKASRNLLGVNELKISVRNRDRSASKSREKSSNRPSERSCDKPLNRLLIREKQMRQEKQDTHLNQTQSVESEESMSYSAIMSASCAVKQRNRPRRGTKKNVFESKNKGSDVEDQEDQKEKGFVFFRPKKGK